MEASLRRRMVLWLVAASVGVVGGLFWYFAIQLFFAIQPTQQGCPYLRTHLRDMCEFDRTFKADSLLVTTTLFDNPDIETSAPNDITKNGAVERYEVGILTFTGNHIGRHEIARWTFTGVAKKIYQQEFTGYTDPNKEYWKVANIDYKSPVADSFQIIQSRDDQRVYRAVGRYQEYISVFEVRISDSFIKDDFVEILKKIDRRFAQYLHLSQQD